MSMKCIAHEIFFVTEAEIIITAKHFEALYSYTILIIINWSINKNVYALIPPLLYVF
ncbi:hypothetical protein DPEC_G00166430 [Dallia pectoralis]|uniref:Uncharacterized protein n=1 Tax=Dallia pectoralis TaxID=75939 RepID=A0ACC2GHK3_DALPE|nr:hypothetical protein DPEC_G00166430 [Dallia pectoralis]